MIVLVDDNPAHRHLVRRSVKKLFPEEDILELQSQGEGLRFVAALKTENIRLAIVDMNLGDGKGTEVISALREKLRELPIITLSTSSLPEDSQEAAQAGSTRYVVKSEDPEQFLSQISTEIRTLVPN